MTYKLRLSDLKFIIREAIILEANDDDDKKGGPIDRMKGWQPPSHMQHGSDATDWSQDDEWDSGDDAFDMGIDEADGSDEEDE